MVLSRKIQNPAKPSPHADKIKAAVATVTNDRYIINRRLKYKDDPIPVSRKSRFVVMSDMFMLTALHQFETKMQAREFVQRNRNYCIEPCQAPKTAKAFEKDLRKEERKRYEGKPVQRLSRSDMSTALHNQQAAVDKLIRQLVKLQNDVAHLINPNM